MPAKRASTQYTTSTTAALRRQKRSVTANERDIRYHGIIAALEKTSQYLAIETDINLILSKIATSFGKALGAKYVNFWDFTPNKQAIYIMAAYGMQRQYIEHSKNHPIKIGTAWVGRTVQTGRPWATQDVQKDPLLPKGWLPKVKIQDYHGLLCVPLKRKNEIIGGMCIYYKDKHVFEYTEMSLANIVASQTATALANAKLFNDLMKEQNKTVAVLQSLKDGLIMYDLDGRILLINSKAQEYLHLNAEEAMAVKTNQDKLDLDVHRRNLDNISQIKLSDFASQEFTIDAPIKRILDITQVPVRYQNEKIGNMQVLRDITKDKEVEFLKSNFVSVASHQLRTPLSGIKWALASINQGDLGDLNSEQRKLIQKIYQANESLISLVSDLLDVSHLEQGKYIYEFSKGDLPILVAKTVDELKALGGKKGVIINLIPPERQLPLINMDAKKLAISIKNVLENAIKYTLGRGHITVNYHLDAANRFLYLMIADEGIGIPPEDQSHIFVKFFRARNAVRLQTEGSGLGLYIAKEIAQAHKINLTFESQVKKGSTFIFQIPY